MRPSVQPSCLLQGFHLCERRSHRACHGGMHGHPEEAAERTHSALWRRLPTLAVGKLKKELASLLNDNSGPGSYGVEGAVWGAADCRECDP